MQNRAVRNFIVESRFYHLVVGSSFTVFEKLLGYPILKFRFKRRTGYRLDLKNPRSFNEKVNYKKIHDRNPLLSVIADKYRVRGYIADRLGEEEAGILCIPILHVSDDPGTIPFDELPQEYVIKTNHRSGTNLIVAEGDGIDREAVIRSFRRQLRVPYALFKHEWGYQNIPRKVLVEPLIRDSQGKLPRDYKFHMIWGRCVMIHVHLGLCDDWDNQTCTVFNKEWEKQDVIWNYPPAADVPRPENLDRMIEIAEALAQPFDMVRVDLYNIDGEIRFGEMTNYPYCGFNRVEPRDFEYRIGDLWELRAEYYGKSAPLAETHDVPTP